MQLINGKILFMARHYSNLAKARPFQDISAVDLSQSLRYYEFNEIKKKTLHVIANIFLKQLVSGRYLIETRRAGRAFKRFLQFYRVEMCNLIKYKRTM